MGIALRSSVHGQVFEFMRRGILHLVCGLSLLDSILRFVLRLLCYLVSVHVVYLCFCFLVLVIDGRACAFCGL